MSGSTRLAAPTSTPRRRRILYRAWTAASREMDLIMGRSPMRRSATMSETELDAFER